MYAFIAIKFPLGTTFAASHQFWCIFPFFVASRYFLNIKLFIANGFYCAKI